MSVKKRDVFLHNYCYECFITLNQAYVYLGAMLVCLIFAS